MQLWGTCYHEAHNHPCKDYFHRFAQRQKRRRPKAGPLGPSCKAYLSELDNQDRNCAGMFSS